MGVASHFSYGCAPGILPKMTAHFIRLLEKGFMRGRLNHHSNQGILGLGHKCRMDLGDFHVSHKGKLTSLPRNGKRNVPIMLCAV